MCLKENRPVVHYKFHSNIHPIPIKQLTAPFKHWYQCADCAEMNERLVCGMPRAHLIYTVHNVRIVSAFLRRDIYGCAVLSVGEFVKRSGKLITSRTQGQGGQVFIKYRPVPHSSVGILQRGWSLYVAAYKIQRGDVDRLKFSNTGIPATLFCSLVQQFQLLTLKV